MGKYILLEEWAKLKGVSPTDAKNWARRGKIKAKKKVVKIERWTTLEDAEPTVWDRRKKS